MKVMKSPMPAAKLAFRFSGMALLIAARAPVMVSIVKSTPPMKTAPSAVCQEYPRTRTTVYATNAFSPMYGAMANGLFA